MEKQEMKTCVLLLLASSKKAFVSQEEKCRALAREKGLEVCMVYRERELLTLRKRKALRWMRAYVHNENVPYVIAYKQRTIARNNSEFFLINRLFNNCDTKFLFVKEKLQPNF